MATDRQLIERIETLQSIMLASVTGGARDEEAYKQLRDELFGVPGLKDALPRFVRTCADLAQLWHFIKSQEGLGSYASRREYIWNAFRPLLNDAEEAQPAEREAFFVKGSDHDAYVHIRAILQQTRGDLIIIDPYMHSTIYQVLCTLSAGSIAVQILTSKIPTDFVLEGQKFVKQRPNYTLEIRTTKDFHDRFIVVDKARCYLLGASIKDAGYKSFTIVPLEDPDVLRFFISHAAQVWAAAAVLL